MSTCKGCWRDWRVPLEPGMVTMVVDYHDGGMDNPWVGHRKEEPCPHGEQPHKMSECPLFLPSHE